MEETISIKIGDRLLHGILHVPDAIISTKAIVIFINGGPQTRVGSHRLYTQLARYLCHRSLFVLRFDYEGLGDSDGDFLGFRFAKPSIGAVLDYVDTRFGKHIRKILWSLCDGATASILYGPEYKDAIAGILICNPYLSDDVTSSQTKIKHYYMKAMLKPGFWRRLLFFDFRPLESLIGLFDSIAKGYGYRNLFRLLGFESNIRLCYKFFESMEKFEGRIGIILSTNDFIALEFHDLYSQWQNKKLRSSNKNISVAYIQNADHTFSNPSDKNQLFDITFKTINLWQELSV